MCIPFSQLDFNKSLLSQLREAQDAAATPGDACIGRIFRDFGPYLKMYSAYVDKHADALKALIRGTTMLAKRVAVCMGR